MTKKILLLLLAISLPMSAYALNPDDMTDADNLQRNGYSPEAVRMVRMQKAKVDGEIVETKYQPKPEPKAEFAHPTTWFRAFMFQLDPAEQGDDFAAQEVDSL